MSRYCSKCDCERPREAMTLYVGKMICRCEQGLPPKKCLGVKTE